MREEPRHRELARELGTLDATAIGLGSMLGAGVFAAFAPAAGAAGAWVLLALVLAAAVAYCNATSSAQLAATYPSSGGTYVYGRRQLGPWWGFTAGWGFVVGKTASCAAMALTFASYTAPGYEKPVAVAAVLVIAAVNYRGITRTALLTKILLGVVLLAITLTVLLGLLGEQTAGSLATGRPDPVGPFDVVRAAGLLFFAFAGYARIATLGEEVRDPARTIPRAIVGALLGAVLVYAAVGAMLLTVLGPQRLAGSVDPLAQALSVTGQPALIARVGAAAASLGALLALIAGVGRTSLAMARNHDLPRALAAVHPRFAVPHRAELVVATVVCVLVLTVDVRGAIGFSSFGVLLYYAVTNASALRQTPEQRRFPRVLQVLGLLGCLALAASLPLPSVLVGLAVFVVGIAGRLITRGGDQQATR